MAKPVLIDTDTGVDDALALILALRSPELSVKAITTVAGNVEVGKCTRNAAWIRDLVRAPDVEVATGSSRPLRRTLTTAPEVHGADGLGNTMRIPAQQQRGTPAIQVIRKLASQFGKNLTIIALGPLTNIARALLASPASVRKAGRIISMGGAFRVPGNTGPVAEFNYFVDPEAAEIVLKSGIPMTIVPLDVTEQIVLMRSELEYRADRRPNRVSRFIRRMTRPYMAYHRKTEGFYGAFLHDPVAVAAAIDPSMFTFQSRRVQIETRGTITRGMTVAESRRKASEGNPVRVAVRIDRGRFLTLFHQRLWA